MNWSGLRDLFEDMRQKLCLWSDMPTGQYPIDPDFQKQFERILEFIPREDRVEEHMRGFFGVIDHLFEHLRRGEVFMHGFQNVSFRISETPPNERRSKIRRNDGG